MANNNTNNSDNLPGHSSTLWIFPDTSLGCTIVFTSYLGLILGIGFPGNLIVIIVYGRTSPKSACDWLILAMGITDAMVCFIAPILLLRWQFQVDIPWMNEAFCCLEFWTQLTAMTASCVILVIIAMDRYAKMCRPTLPSLTPVMARNVCICSVIICGVFCVFPTVEGLGKTVCLIRQLYLSEPLKMYYTSLFGVYVLSFILVIFAYGNVCKRISEKIKIKRRLMEDRGLKPRRLVENTGLISPEEGETGKRQSRWFESLRTLRHGFRKWRGKSRTKMDVATEKGSNGHTLQLNLTTTEEEKRQDKELQDEVNELSTLLPAPVLHNAQSSEMQVTPCTVTNVSIHAAANNSPNNIPDDQDLLQGVVQQLELSKNIEAHFTGDLLKETKAYNSCATLQPAEYSMVSIAGIRADSQYSHGSRQFPQEMSGNNSNKIAAGSTSIALQDVEFSKGIDDFEKYASDVCESVKFGEDAKVSLPLAKPATTPLTHKEINNSETTLNPRTLSEINMIKDMSPCTFEERSRGMRTILSSPELSRFENEPLMCSINYTKQRTYNEIVNICTKQKAMPGQCELFSDDISSALRQIPYSSMPSDLNRSSVFTCPGQLSQSLQETSNNKLELHQCQPRNSKDTDTILRSKGPFQGVHVVCGPNQKFLYRLNGIRSCISTPCKTEFQTRYGQAELSDNGNCYNLSSSFGIQHRPVNKSCGTAHYEASFSSLQCLASYNLEESKASQLFTRQNCKLKEGGITSSPASQISIFITEIDQPIDPKNVLEVTCAEEYTETMCTGNDASSQVFPPIVFLDNASTSTTDQEKLIACKEIAENLSHWNLENRQETAVKDNDYRISTQRNSRKSEQENSLPEEENKETSELNVKEEKLHLQQKSSITEPTSVESEGPSLKSQAKDSHTLAPPFLRRPRSALRSTGSASSRESNNKIPSFADLPNVFSYQDTDNCADGNNDDDDEVFGDVSTTVFYPRWRKILEREGSKNSKSSVKSTGSRKLFARERQMTLMLLSVTASFILTWLPAWIIYLVIFYSISDPNYKSIDSIWWYLATTNLINYVASPVIYYVFNPTYRTKVQQMCMSIRKILAYCKK